MTKSKLVPENEKKKKNKEIRIWYVNFLTKLFIKHFSCVKYFYADKLRNFRNLSSFCEITYYLMIYCIIIKKITINLSATYGMESQE